MEKILQNTEKNKNILFLTLSVCAAAFAVLAIVYSVYEAKAFRQGEPHNTISVQGKGEIDSVPNIAEISFTIRGEGKSIAMPQGEVKAKAIAITKLLTDMGIDAKDIKTTSYTSAPKYEYTNTTLCMGCAPSGTPKISGYEVLQSTSVKVRDTALVDKVFETIGKNGINEIYGPNFTIDDNEKTKDEAQALAIKDARENAEILAKQLGVKIVKIVSFQADAYCSGCYRASESKMSLDSAGAPAISQGTNTVTSNVTVTYEIR